MLYIVLVFLAFVITVSVSKDVGGEKVEVLVGGSIRLQCPFPHSVSQPVLFFKMADGGKLLLHSSPHDSARSSRQLLSQQPPSQQPPTQQLPSQQPPSQQPTSQQLPSQQLPSQLPPSQLPPQQPASIFQQPPPQQPSSIFQLSESQESPHSSNLHPSNFFYSRITQQGDRMLIEGVQAGDGGDYGCKKEGGDGGDVGDGDVIIASVSVLGSPRVLSFSNVTMSVGGEVMMECVVKGSSGVMINSSTHPSGIPALHQDGRMGVRMVEDHTLQLLIKSLQPSDTGFYTCTAFQHPFHHSLKAHLTVLFPPEISPTQAVVYTWLHHTTNFTCPFTSHPSPIVEWEMGEGGGGEGAVIYEDTNTLKVFVADDHTSLQIRVHKQDQTWVYRKYTCTVSNSLGSAQRTFTLARASTPDVPVLASKDITATRVRLLVTPPEENGGVPVIGYALYKQDAFLMDFNQSGEVVLEGLTPNTLYHWRVRARNEVGLGVPLSFHAKTSKIATPELELESYHGSSFAFSHPVSWKVVADGGLPVTDYQVFVRQITPHSSTFNNLHNNLHNNLQQPPDDTWTKHSTTGVNNTFLLTGLSAGGAYEVVVRGKNEVGWSSYTSPHFFTTRYATPKELQDQLTHHFSLLLTILIFLLILLLSIIIITALVCRHRWLPGYHASATATDKQSFGRRSHCSINSSRPSNNTTPVHHSISPITTQNSNTTLLLRHSNSATPIPNQRSNTSTPTSALLSTANQSHTTTNHQAHPPNPLPPDLPPRNPPNPHSSSQRSSPHHLVSRQLNSHHTKHHPLTSNQSSSLPITHRSHSPHTKLLPSKLPTSSSHHSSPHHFLPNHHSSKPHQTPKRHTQGHSNTPLSKHPAPPPIPLPLPPTSSSSSSSQHPPSSDQKKKTSVKHTSLPPVPV